MNQLVLARGPIGQNAANPLRSTGHGGKALERGLDRLVERKTLVHVGVHVIDHRAGGQAGSLEDRRSAHLVRYDFDEIATRPVHAHPSATTYEKYTFMDMQSAASSLFVAYYRVSTERQGESGLGLEAQREAVARFVGSASLLSEFTEIESGKRHTNRPELLKAIELSRKCKATLVIAKIDRLARNVQFISGLMETGVEFVAADMPQANRLTIHSLAAFAEHEREAGGSCRLLASTICQPASTLCGREHQSDQMGVPPSTGLAG